MRGRTSDHFQMCGTISVLRLGGERVAEHQPQRLQPQLTQLVEVQPGRVLAAGRLRACAPASGSRVPSRVPSVSRLASGEMLTDSQRGPLRAIILAVAHARLMTAP